MQHLVLWCHLLFGIYSNICAARARFSSSDCICHILVDALVYSSQCHSSHKLIQNEVSHTAFLPLDAHNDFRSGHTKERTLGWPKLHDN